VALIKKFRRSAWEGGKIVLLALFVLGFLYLAQPSRASLLIGLPIILLGLFVRCWAAGHLRRNKELTTSGPYAYVRDPLYLGRLLLLCGFAVAANSPGTWGLFAVGILVFFLDYMPRKLRKETQRLERIFGDQYRKYRSEVRSLLPRRTPWPERSRRPWSLQVFFRENREYYLVLAVVIGYTVLLWKAGVCC